MAEHPPEVTFLAVNYNSVEDSLALALSFDRSRERLGGRAELFLIDNSTGAAARELATALGSVGSGVTCISPGENLGYFGGLRFGISALRARNLWPRWLVVSNVDLIFDPVNFVEGLSAVSAQTVGVVAPSVYSKLSKRALNPYMRRRPSAARMHSYKWVYRHYFSMRTYEWLAAQKARLRLRLSWPTRATYVQESPVSGPSAGEEIYAGHGSILAFSAEYFRRGGNLDHGPFLFGEEITVAESARRLSLPLLWMPSLHVEHAEHVSVGKLPGRRMHEFLKEATAYCADVYF